MKKFVLIESIMLMVAGGAFCAYILYGILTGTSSVNKDIWGFVIFAATFFLGLWRIITKKSDGFVKNRVSINRRIYKLFLKSNKWKFVIVSGLYSVVPIGIILFFSVVWSLYQLELEAYLIFIGIISGHIIYTGYKNYIKYSSLNMDSEVVQYHYKEILNDE